MPNTQKMTILMGTSTPAEMAKRSLLIPEYHPHMVWWKIWVGLARIQPSRISSVNSGEEMMVSLNRPSQYEKMYRTMNFTGREVVNNSRVTSLSRGHTMVVDENKTQMMMAYNSTRWLTEMRRQKIIYFFGCV